MPGYFKALVLSLALLGYLVLIELVSYVVSRRFNPVFGGLR